MREAIHLAAKALPSFSVVCGRLLLAEHRTSRNREQQRRWLAVCERWVKRAARPADADAVSVR
jgi:hypothetical protein